MTGIVGSTGAKSGEIGNISKDLSDVENTKLSTWVGSSAITTLGTIATGSLNSTIHGAYKLMGIGHQDYAGQSSTSTLSIEDGSLSLMGTTYMTMPVFATADFLILTCNPGSMHRTAGYSGYGLTRATNTGFTTGHSLLWGIGEHAEGHGAAQGTADPYWTGSWTRTKTVGEWGLSADTTYYLRAIGQVHNVASTFYWGQNQTGGVDYGANVGYELWKAV